MQLQPDHQTRFCQNVGRQVHSAFDDLPSCLFPFQLTIFIEQKLFHFRKQWMRFVSGIILILSKYELHSLSWWRHCKKNRKKVVFLGIICPIIDIHMQIFFFHEFYAYVICIIRISICDRGRSVFTFKSRWLSRIHVHFLSLFVEHWHFFNIDLIKKNTWDLV